MSSELTDNLIKALCSIENYKGKLLLPAIVEAFREASGNQLATVGCTDLVAKELNAHFTFPIVQGTVYENQIKIVIEIIVKKLKKNEYQLVKFFREIYAIKMVDEDLFSNVEYMKYLKGYKG
ncbi:MAG: hypothetical protein CME61_00375 [Halobacteriovoraceae bacterium]|nr:hypothetical protein [Halobacteriovoraceae bacterium]